MILLIGICAVFPGSGYPQEIVYTDPLTPPKPADSPEEKTVPFYRIRPRLLSIDEQIQTLENKLAALPPIQNSMQFSAYGYQSDHLPILNTLPEKPRWTLEIESPRLWMKGMDFVMIPSCDWHKQTPTSVGFPKRFRLVSADENKPEEVLADWTQTDFPDPGLRPVYFHLPQVSIDRMRLEVFKGYREKDQEYFSLARLHVVRHQEPQLIKEVTASSSFELPPYWSTKFLKDERSVLGLPTSEKTTSNSDFAIDLLEYGEDPQIMVEIDLGANHAIGWILLYPAQSPQSFVASPGYGFPLDGNIQLVQENDDGSPGKMIGLDTMSLFRSNPGNNLQKFPCYDSVGRWIRFYFNQLPIYNNHTVFAMGELEAIRGVETLSLNKSVRVVVNGRTVHADASALTDGRCNGREILPLVDWYQKQASGKPLETKLALLKAERGSLLQRWHTVQTLFGWTIAVAALLTGGGLGTYMFRKRRRDTMRLRRQIGSDLHDDIGSQIAAISLACSDVEEQADNEHLRACGSKIRSVATGMHQAIRDVLWVTDTETDLLDQLVRKLVDCARACISEKQLILQVSPIRSIPNKPVKLQTKRDLLLFFKEALNNAAQHSGASEIQVGVRWENRELCLSVKDNGRGFEMERKPQEPQSIRHYGIQTMRERSSRLHGKLRIDSCAESGTEIELRVII